VLLLEVVGRGVLGVPLHRKRQRVVVLELDGFDDHVVGSADGAPGPRRSMDGGDGTAP
jgi:hypothetical protein